MTSRYEFTESRYECYAAETQDAYNTTIINAISAKEAAEKFTEKHNFETVEFPPTTDVYIRKIGSGEWKLYEVELEAIPFYTARKK